VVIIYGIVMISNRKDDSLYADTNIEGAVTSTNVTNQTNDIVTIDNQQVELETIELIIDSDLMEFIHTITDLCGNISESVEIKQAISKEEFINITQVNYLANIKSISFGYFSDDAIEEATSNGTIVEKSIIVEDVYYVITGIEEAVASDIIDELRPAEEAVAEKVAAEQVAAEQAAAEQAAAEQAAAEQAAAEQEAAEQAAAEQAAVDKAAADKAAAEKAAEKADECEYCDGTGKVECTWCDGTGICKIGHLGDDGEEYIYEGNPCPKTTICTWCDGTGKK
jgi:hypothetical protein